MKNTTNFASAILVMACGVGNVHAAVCAGGLTGVLDFGAYDTSTLTCTGSGTFLWERENPAEAGLFFRLGATITPTLITLRMVTGGIGFFEPGPLWTFTQPSGSIFGPISETTNTFNDDFEGLPTGGDVVSLNDNGGAAVQFQISGGDGVFYPADRYTATFTTSVLPVNSVPEPESWQLALGGLALLAFVRRRRPI